MDRASDEAAGRLPFAYGSRLQELLHEGMFSRHDSRPTHGTRRLVAEMAWSLLLLLLLLRRLNCFIEIVVAALIFSDQIVVEELEKDTRRRYSGIIKVVTAEQSYQMCHGRHERIVRDWHRYKLYVRSRWKTHHLARGALNIDLLRLH
ncbi:unnamed protein product [Calypogeia fissa]